MANYLDKINHIVVLMLENRSFDRMAGFLYDPSNAPPFDRVPRGQPFEGLSGKSLSNPSPGGGSFSARQSGDLSGPDPDPGEEFEHINMQLYGVHPAPTPLPAQAPMSGFVIDYANVIHEYNTQNPRQPTTTAPSTIMECFSPADVPVISGLAHHFAICDHWFCSVPSQTWTNRSFVHAATSSGRVNNCNPGWILPVPNGTRTIFNVMEAARLRWRIYYDIESVVPLSILAQDQLIPFYETNFSYMNQFLIDAATPNGLSEYSFIEPRFLLDHNDQHPGGLLIESVTNGERLISDVYRAIRNGPNWKDTLLIISYDEHGGCYDHVPPPTNATPPDGVGATGQCGFRFDRYGVRVCTVLVSPLIEQGTVFRPIPSIPNLVGAGSALEFLPLDHTSIIKTITSRWGLPSLTQRDANAADISGALTVWPPRDDAPTAIEPRHAVMMATGPTGVEPLTDFQQQFIAAGAARLVPFKGAPAALLHGRTVREATEFLRDRASMFPRPH